MTQLTSDPARTLRLAADLESLATALHRTDTPPLNRPSGMDADVAAAHLVTVRAAADALAALADGLLTDADRLLLVAATHRRAEEQSTATLDRLREPARPRGIW
ncbi:hypothetical protein Cco03nite_48950 [Catellatospora coxensis]|uniref:Uncharacterized protein n=2 Tax=Catellatospora coxensis TaxID=310354 RepID=A0A8J3KW64_9ACTN|nr:hypothetical protein Cco03nite_48950 [Catellatospora coxensis]